MALNVLFVHEFGTPTAAEQAMIDLLEGRGDTVTGQNEGSATNPWPITPGTYDVIILGESANNIQDWPGLRSTTDPILTVGIGWADLNLVTSADGSTAKVGISVVDAAHPIAVAAGLAAGSNTVYSSGVEMDRAVSLASGADVVAEDPNVAGRVVIATFDQGADLTTGTAAGRRVLFGLVEANNYNALGQAVFLASVDWAADALGGSVSVELGGEESEAGTESSAGTFLATSVFAFTGVEALSDSLAEGGTFVGTSPAIRVDDVLQDTDTGELIDIESAEVVVLGGTPGSRTIVTQNATFEVADGVVEIPGAYTLDAEYLVALVESSERMSILPATVVDRNA